MGSTARNSYGRYLQAAAVSGAILPGSPHEGVRSGATATPSSSQALPLGPDDGVIEHIQRVYNSNPVLYGSLIVLVALWASLRLKY